MTAQQTGEPVDATDVDEDVTYSLRLAAGIYQVMVSATGFVSQTIEAKVETGSYKTIDFSLVATC